jgi:hypothetical protein
MDKAQVINNQTINFPATQTGPIPQPFLYPVPFTTPFVFLAQGSFCWEAQVTARTNTVAVYHDAVDPPTAEPPIWFTPYGTGCKLSTIAGPLTLATTTTVSWASGTGSITLTGTNGLPNSAVVEVVGFNINNYGGIPLPFLIPGSATAPSGPCSLLTSIAFFNASMTDGSGRSTRVLNVPATPDLHGGNALVQLLAFDAAANPAGVVTSNGASHGWTAPFASVPMSRNFLSGSLGTSGTVATRNGLVTKFN